MREPDEAALLASLARLTHGQRILSVAAEMHRAKNMLGRNEHVEAKRCYARALDIMDRLCELPERPRDLREYRRWRELAAGLYAGVTPSEGDHLVLERLLIQLHPDAWNAFFPGRAA